MNKVWLGIYAALRLALPCRLESVFFAPSCGRKCPVDASSNLTSAAKLDRGIAGFPVDCLGNQREECTRKFPLTV